MNKLDNCYLTTSSVISKCPNSIAMSLSQKASSFIRVPLCLTNLITKRESKSCALLRDSLTLSWYLTLIDKKFTLAKRLKRAHMTMQSTTMRTVKRSLTPRQSTSLRQNQVNSSTSLMPKRIRLRWTPVIAFSYQPITTTNSGPSKLVPELARNK